MDFLDSLDLDTTNKKCHRVRSWYLYEQYKSLEKNQLDAARRLKNKSYQDKILRQEIKERRERRRLNFGPCQSESQIEKTIKSIQPRASLSVNADDLCDSFCELHDGYLCDFNDNTSHDSSLNSKHFEDWRGDDGVDNMNEMKSENKNNNNKKEDSDDESVNSVIKNVTFDKNLADDVKGELEIVKKNIAENINLQLDTVKENIECLEKFTKLGDAEDLPENNSSDLFEQCESSEGCATTKDKTLYPRKDKEFFPTWAKLVAFAYETVKFNRGNFYNSYGSQLMLAVLLCDVLRRGIIRICNILQPYVSPIKYSTSDSDISVDSYKTAKRKTTVCSSKCLSAHYRKTPKFCDKSKHQPRKRVKSCQKLRWLHNREYQSENKLQQPSKCSFENRFNEMKYRDRASEPWHCAPEFIHKQKCSGNSNSSIWPEEFSRTKFSEESVCKCRCLRNVSAPMLQLARYIESVLQDVED